MAESNAAGEESSNWWGSWITSAKTKSASVFEAVKKDLDEISTAVRSEVSHAGSIIGETLRLDEPESTANTVKRSLSSFIGQVSEVLVPSQEEDDAEAVLITSDGAVTLTGFQKHLAELQVNEDTYLQAPDGELEENYKRWMGVVEQDQFTQSRLTKHLSSSEILNEKYLSLVPEKVPHMEFWKRYLFKRAILEDALANAEIAERKAKTEQDSMKTSLSRTSLIQTDQPKKVIDDEDVSDVKTDPKPETDTTASKDDDIKWDAEEFGNEEISEEEQARLLQEYEKEMQEREARKDGKEKTKKTNHKSNNNNKKGQQQSKTMDKSQNSEKAKANKPITDSATKNDTDRDDTIVPIQKDHFSSDSKDDAASDESWEKDFDLAEK